MVKWLEMLGYVAEVCEFIFWLGSSRYWKSLSVNPAVNGYLI